MDKAMSNLNYPRVPNDLYETPAEVTQALLNSIGPVDTLATFWDPACGNNAIINVLRAHYPNASITGSDIIHGYDFLTFPIALGNTIITNPPYGRLAEAFIKRGLSWIESGEVHSMILLLRNEYDCAKSRIPLFRDNPYFGGKFVLTWRPRWIPNSTGAPRHNYAWYIWDRHYPTGDVNFLSYLERP